MFNFSSQSFNIVFILKVLIFKLTGLGFGLFGLPFFSIFLFLHYFSVEQGTAPRAIELLKQKMAYQIFH